MIQDTAILANILIVLFIALAMVPPYLVARKIWLTWTRSLDEPEPETYGDDGGMPMPADYSDDVTDKHLKQIRKIVDQGEFENAEVISGPAWVKYKRVR